MEEGKEEMGWRGEKFIRLAILLFPLFLMMKMLLWQNWGEEGKVDVTGCAGKNLSGSELREYKRLGLVGGNSVAR